MAYLVKRASSALLALLVVSLLTFIIFRAIPGNPAAIMLGTEARPEAITELSRQLGLNQPLVAQYLSWMGGVVRGSLGESIRLSQSVTLLVFERLPITIGLAGLALVMTVAVSIPLGIMAAYRRGSLVDRSISMFSQLGMTLPYFWLGILLILLFSIKLGWLPPGGYVPWSESPVESVTSLLLPSIALAVQRIGIMTGVVRAAVLDELSSDYVRTARGKGVHPYRIAYVHVLRNAAIPVVTVLGLQLAGLMSGTIVAEQVFALPGVGQLLVMGVAARDLPLAQGVVLLMASGIVLVNLVVDLVYGLIDPRLRYS